MFLNCVFVLLLPILIANVHVSNGLVCKGCVELDELNFDKVIAKFQSVLVKFDIAFPYGKKHDEYAKFAREISVPHENSDDLIVCVIGIKSYGEPINAQLNERFDIGDQLPAIKLFTNYSTLIWSNFPKDENVTVENLRRFVRRKSMTKILLFDCSKQFDDYAATFVKALKQFKTPDAEQVQAIVSDALNQATKLEIEHEKQTAQIYLLIMRRILERDISFIGAERMRLEQLLDEKISDRKRSEIHQKLNILAAFELSETMIAAADVVPQHAEL